MTSKNNVIIIRNLREFLVVTETEKEEAWAHLEREITKILNSGKSSYSLEELYQTAENLYTLNYSPLLQNLQLILENHLQRKLELLVEKQENLLEEANNLWMQFCKDVKTIRNIFLRYDRSPKFLKYNTVQSISLNLFASTIILDSKIKTKLISEALDEIQIERKNATFEKRSLLMSLFEMLNLLQVYEDIFLKVVLQSTEDFYEEESVELVKKLKTPDYLTYVNRRITEEKQRIKNYFTKSTELPLLEIVYEQLIENHISDILNEGFDELLERNMFNELSLVHQLFENINEGTKHLNNCIKDYTIKKGTTLTNPKNEKNMIEDILSFKESLNKIIQVSFEDKKEFHECVKAAFKVFINYNYKAARLLAKYLDLKMRGKDLSDDELEVILNKALELFKYIQSKDIFGAFYKKLLARRLLLGKSANQDAESSMISKLKEECGSAFTSNIEGMFQDVNLSKTINSSFREKLKHRKSANSEFSVNVLTSSYWPNFPTCNVNLPLELVTYQQDFQKFYLSKHSGRNLIWQPNLGYCLVKGNFDCGCKELQVSLYQTLVLLLFNEDDSLTCKEIQENTNLEINEVKRTLFSLVYGKAKILLGNSQTKEISEDDTFSFNNNFTDKLYRVKINQIQLQDTPEIEKEIENHVLVDRQFQIDAAIVRIMKDKKVITHGALVKELYKILDVPVNQADLKRRIELLIERDYMERDKDNKSTYVYVA